MRNQRSKLISALLAIALLLPWSVAYATDAGDDVVGYVADASPTVPNDKYFDEQWALTKIQALDAWQITSGSQDILIAVLDTGINQKHEELVGKVQAEVNFTKSATADDIYGHGTHVAGIIAASADNGIGIAGMIHQSQLMNVKVVEDNGQFYGPTLAKGIIWAVDNGAKVINISLTIARPSQALEDAVDYAWSKGAIIVAAAGNNGGSTPMYPAYYANSLAVTATDSNDLLVQLAKHGDWVDVAAPGANIYSTLPDNDYGFMSGTSMATAYAAGLAGLLFTVVTDANGNGRLNDEVREAIENSSDEIGGLGVNKGRINASEAVRR